MRGGHHEVARAYVLYRERRAQERAKQAPAPRRAGRAGADGHRPRRSACRSTSRALQALIESACAGLGADVEPEPILAETRAQPVRRRADRRGAQGGDPGRAHADREGPGLHARHRAPAAAHDPARDPRRGGAAGGHGDALRRVLPAVHQEGRRRPSCSTSELLQFDLQRLGAALKADRDLQFDYLGLQTLYDRYFLHIDERAHRAAAGLLHARGDGPGAERDRPRGARDRVLRGAVELRLHELDADAVQRRHAALAAVELLPDDRRRRPRRHLRGAQGERAAAPSSPAAWATTGPTCARSAPHQGHQRQEPGRGAVPEGRQRHRGGGQPGRQAQGRGLRLPRKLAPRHRGVPRAAQEHRRRPPPHARHEHRQLGSRPVHEAGDGRRRLDAVLAVAPAPTCTTSSAGPSRRPTLRYEDKAARGEIKLFKKMPARDLWRKMLSMLFETGHPVDHVQGRLQRALAAAARRRRPHSQPVHRDHAEHQRHARSRSATSARSTWRQHVDATAQARPGQAEEDVAHGDADARQRHRHQLLRGQEGAQLATCATARSAWASWASRTACTSCACRTRRAKRSSSPTARWKRSATTPTGPRPSWPRSAAAIRATAARCGTAASCRSDSLDLLAEQRGGYVERRHRAVDARLGRAARSASASTACATPTAWRSRRPRRSPTSSASAPRSSRRSATCRSSRTCRASSRSSTSTWCAT